MKFWEDMQTKHGFDSGAATPCEAEACRYVYVTAMNKLLKENCSEYRVVSWDRGGVHNSILIVLVPADVFTDEELSAWNSYMFGSTMARKKVEEFDSQIEQHRIKQAKPDDGWEHAWDEAGGLDLDDFVRAKVIIDPRFQEWLAGGKGPGD